MEDGPRAGWVGVHAIAVGWRREVVAQSDSSLDSSTQEAVERTDRHDAVGVEPSSHVLGEVR